MLLVDDGVQRHALEQLGISMAWLRAVGTASSGPVLRCYQPSPTVAFSGRDCLADGISVAAQVARNHGFAPVRRAVGGRATAYHRNCLGLDWIGVESASVPGIGERFTSFGNLLAQALRSVGVAADVGPVAGEYCPGDFSVNDGAGHKLVGTAQRLIRGAWLFSAMIVVDDPDAIRAVLDPVYTQLGLDWNPGSVGSVTQVVAGGTVEQVKAAIIQQCGSAVDLVVGESPPAVLAAAREWARHQPPLG